MKEIRITPDGRSVLFTSKKADLVDWALMAGSEIGLLRLVSVGNTNQTKIIRHPLFRGDSHPNPPTGSTEDEITRANFLDARGEDPTERKWSKSQIVVIKNPAR